MVSTGNIPKIDMHLATPAAMRCFLEALMVLTNVFNGPDGPGGPGGGTVTTTARAFPRFPPLA